MRAPERMRVAVVVLGDLGNSPRMQYHALALATTLADVDLIGYAGSPLGAPITTHPHIHLHLMRAPRPAGQHLPRVLFVGYGVWRIVTQCLHLLWLLLIATARPDFLLVQNPPAIPTLWAAWLAARVRSATFVVDWHNFGYAMLALRMGQRHPVVRAARWHERRVGRRAGAHFCVSRAMQAELAAHWGVDAIVLYDRPAQTLGPTPLTARRALFDRLAGVLASSTGPYRPDAADRRALIVSPTGWTADEDVGTLLEALAQWEDKREQAANGNRRIPDLLVLITGRGPRRAAFEARMQQLKLRRIVLRTLWVPPEDYPLLLGAADLGLCLHRSASGVDLPMKVADMFGAGLPVCALDYGPCLAEQIEHGETGLLFSTAAQLAEQLYALLNGFPDDTPVLDRLRRNVAARCTRRWADEWAAKAQPVFAERRGRAHRLRSS